MVIFLYNVHILYGHNTCLTNIDFPWFPGMVLSLTESDTGSVKNGFALLVNRVSSIGKHFLPVTNFFSYRRIIFKEAPCTGRISKSYRSCGGKSTRYNQFPKTFCHQHVGRNLVPKLGKPNEDRSAFFETSFNAGYTRSILWPF